MYSQGNLILLYEKRTTKIFRAIKSCSFLFEFKTLRFLLLLYEIYLFPYFLVLWVLKRQVMNIIFYRVLYKILYLYNIVRGQQLKCNYVFLRKKGVSLWQ